MELFEAIEGRHSCRAFRRDAIPRDLLQRVSDAAKEAPSIFNEQPWHFYITRGETRARVGEIMAQSTRYLEEYIEVFGQEFYDQAVQWYSDMGHAPVIIVCTMSASDDEHSRSEKLFAMGAAVQNMLLAAEDEGLGACTVSHSHWVADEMLEAVGAPEEAELSVLVVVGYPNEDSAQAATHDAPHTAVFLD